MTSPSSKLLGTVRPDIFETLSHKCRQLGSPTKVHFSNDGTLWAQEPQVRFDLMDIDNAMFYAYLAAKILTFFKPKEWIPVP